MNFASALLQQNEKLLRSISKKAGEVRPDAEISLDGALVVQLTHSIYVRGLGERRLDRMHTIGEIKERLHLVVGTQPAHMHIEFWHEEPYPERICVAEDDDRPLGTYPVYDNCRLHVIDLCPNMLADLDLEGEVEKYVMPDDVYDQREGTVRQFMKENPELFRRHKHPRHLKLGDHCVIQDADIEPGEQRAGTIRFVGETQFAPGQWCGIELDCLDMGGKHDGTVDDVQYFECEQGRGIFIRPARVTPVVKLS